MKYILALLSIISSIPSLSAQSPLTLQDCIALARQQGPGHFVDRWALERSQLSLRQARAPFQINADVDLTMPTYNEFSGTRESLALTSRFRTEDIDFSYSGDLNISQRVPHVGRFTLTTQAERRNFLSNRSTNFVDYRGDLILNYSHQILTQPGDEINLKNAELGYANARSTFRRSELTLESEVVETYYNLVQGIRQLTIVEQRREQSKASFELTQRKFEIGLVPETQALSLKVDLLVADAEYDRAKTDIERRRDQLRNLLGMDLDEALEIDTEVDDKRYAISQDRAIAAALKHRLDLQEAEISEEINALDLKQTKQRNGPTATVNASVGLRGQGDEIGEVGSTFERNRWNVGIQVQMPLIDGGNRQAQIGRAQIALEQAKHSRKTLRRNVILNVKNALRNLGEAERQIELNGQRLEVAERNYDLERSRFDLGFAESQQLLEAQASLTSASINALDAVITYQRELKNLRLATMADFDELVEGD